MTTELASRPASEVALAGHIDALTLEKLIVSGDLTGLTPRQRISYYQHRCLAAGLDPSSQPFEYVSFPKSNKLVLYAKKTASDQLIAIHRLDVRITSKGPEPDAGIYMATARVTFPDGRACEDVGAVSIDNVAGDQLANAIMKAVTKAKRRAVLSACGLGMLGEGEPETVPGARRVIVDDGGEIVAEEALNGTPVAANNSGHGRGSYASPEQSRAYEDALRSWIEKKNQDWDDSWPTSACDLFGPKEPGELLSTWQANGHLVKWAVETGRLDSGIIPEDCKSSQKAKYVAVVYHRSKDDRRALGLEMERYAAEQAARRREAIYRKYPEIRPDEVGAEDDVVPDEFTEPEGDESGREPGED